MVRTWLTAAFILQAAQGCLLGFEKIHDLDTAPSPGREAGPDDGASGLDAGRSDAADADADAGHRDASPDGLTYPGCAIDVSLAHVALCVGPLSWHEAEYACASMSMQLAHIFSEQENEWMTEKAAELLGNGTTLWLGGTDAAIEGTWTWPDGDAFWADGPVSGRYSAWAVGEPNNSGNEDCLQLQATGMWNDQECLRENAFACRKPEEVR